MRLSELLNINALERLVADKYINVRAHPTLPLRIYNYGPLAQINRHWPYEVCQCRGLIVDDQDNVVSRPMFKFFNLNQEAFLPMKDGWENVILSEGFLIRSSRWWVNTLSITEKIDGMMGVLYEWNGSYGIATRGSFTSEGAIWASEKFQKFVKYGAVEHLPKGWTLIFEIVAKHLRIVVPYNFEGLVLLTAVNNETGEEATYPELHHIWSQLNQYAKNKPWCRLVDKFDATLVQCVANAKSDKEGEGYVVSVARKGLPPIKAKVKLEEYLRIHRMVFGTTAQMIWETIGDPLKPLLKHEADEGLAPAEFRKWVLDWDKKLHKEFHKILFRVMEMTHAVRYVEVALKHDEGKIHEFLQMREKELAGIALELWRGNVSDAYHSIWKLVRPMGREDPRYPRDVFREEGEGEGENEAEEAVFDLRPVN